MQFYIKIERKIEAMENDVFKVKKKKTEIGMTILKNTGINIF
jgi:hypothetical protein